MEAVGVVFDIKEFAVFDGPGIRTTVFLKGCPLRCQWCHNPEGLFIQPELMVSGNGCTHCNRCKEVCQHPDKCVQCGECIRVCPNRLRKICGVQYTADELARKLLRDKEYLTNQHGGVTFSGGEPTLQGEFLLKVLEKLDGMHCAIETSGYCSAELFEQLLQHLDYIIMDLKLIDEEKHIHYTGVSNRKILYNLEQLKKSGKPFLIRIPVIPGVNDTEENYIATAKLLQNVPALEKVELLPYHQTAGAKYGMVGKTYQPEFDIQKKPDLNTDIFTAYGIPCSVI